MFTQTWKKYLAVIIILLKRSVQGQQVLSMNHTDFERSAGGRKMKYNFSNLRLTKGRINTDEQHSVIARELGIVLQEDEIAKKLIANQWFEFSMTNNFKLTITNNTPPPEVPVEELAEQEAGTVA